MKKISIAELIEKIEEIRACIIQNRKLFQTETFPVHENYLYPAIKFASLQKEHSLTSYSL
jgi:hypothetical protein